MSLQIVEVARPASDPNRQQQASFLAMLCMTHVRSIGARRILHDDAAHPDDVELSSAMEAALCNTVYRSASSAALRRIKDAAPQEKGRIEFSQEERHVLLAYIESLTELAQLKACCVEFGLSLCSGDTKFIVRARLRDLVKGKLGPSKKRRRF
ncbi:hypothetical protein JL722_8282 [Aureococcus anophagefferens]|nr:hypothetical protein JL722_8282 [Aureococcus anophagefferens]